MSDPDYMHAEAAYKAYCRELRNGSQRMTSESRQIAAPVAWEWLTTIEKSAWLMAVTAALDARDSWSCAACDRSIPRSIDPEAHERECEGDRL